MNNRRHSSLSLRKISRVSYNFEPEMWDKGQKVFRFGCDGSLLRNSGSVVNPSGLSCPEACGIIVPPPGIEFESPALKGGSLTTGPPRKSPKYILFISKYHTPPAFSQSAVKHTRRYVVSHASTTNKAF